MALFQPTRLFISSDDKILGTHNDFTVELPDSIIGATEALVSFSSVPYLVYSFGKHQTTLYWKAKVAFDIINAAGTVIGSTSMSSVLATKVPLLATELTTDLTSLCNKINAAIITPYTASTDTGTYVYADTPGSLINVRVRAYSGTTATYGLRFTVDDATKKLKFDQGAIPAASQGIVFMGWNQPHTDYYNNLSFWISFPNPTTPVVDTWWKSSADYVAGKNPYAFPSLLRTANIYLISDFATGDNQGTSGRKDVLTKIPVDEGAQFGSIIQFQDSIGAYTIKRLPRAIRRMRFALVDDDYMPLGIPDEGAGGVSIEILLKYE